MLISKFNFHMKKLIVKTDSIIPSFCLHHLCRNGLSYLGEETQPTLCKSDAKQSFCIGDLEQNKQQMLHRIKSIRT